MTTTLTPNQLALVQVAAELNASADCLKQEWEEDGHRPDDFRLHLSNLLRRNGIRLWKLVDELED